MSTATELLSGDEVTSGKLPSDHLIIVDGHVHIYDCYDLTDFLSAAARNLTSVARSFGVKAHTGVLALTETSRDHWYSKLRNSAQHGDTAGDEGEWSFRCTDDCAVFAQYRGNDAFAIVAGRQVVTSEGLEVLAVATDSMFEDGQPLADLLQRIDRQQGIPIIPWAVGKWLGRRGTVLQRALQSQEVQFLLGDNGGRPILWRNPHHFRLARAAGINIVPGSDPLPLPFDAERVGSFGCTVHGSLSYSHPVADLKRLLLDPNAIFEPFGALMRPYRFLRNQIMLRLI